MLHLGGEDGRPLLAEFRRTMWVRNDAMQHLGFPFLLWFENHSLRQFLARRSYNSEMCAKASAATCLWLTTPHPTRFTRTHLPPRLRFY